MEKLTASSLMIGDWVQIVSDAPTMANEYHRIDWIRTGEIGLDNRKIVTYPFIRPIPLTPEILERNEFDCSDPEVKQYRFVEDNVKYCFSLRQMYNKDNEPDGFSFYAFGVLTLILYVHDLQHAFRLCGIEKEIEL